MNKHTLSIILIFSFYFNQMTYGSVVPQNRLASYKRVNSTNTNSQFIGKDFIKYNGIPNNSFVDKIHSLNSPFLSAKEKSLYAIRFLKTVELIRSRKALLELLAPYSKKLDRSTPVEIEKTHPKNPQIQLLTSQLDILINDSKLGRYDQTAYKKSFNESLEVLARVSSLLSLIDAKVFYLQHTIFIEHNIKFKGRIIKDFGIDRLIAKLLGQRAYILAKYPTLGMLQDKKEFYKHIYTDLWGAQYFPKALIRNASSNSIFYERVIYNSLDKNISEEPLPFHFEEKLSLRLAKKWKNFKIHLIGKKIRDMFSKVLMSSLKANTIALKQLNKELLIKNTTQVFDIIGMDKKIWGKLPSSFPYINPKIFSKGRRQYEQEMSRKEEIRLKKNEQSTYLGAGTLGTAVLIGLAGAGAIPVLIVSSVGALFFIDNDYKNYTLYKEYTHSAQNLYSAGTLGFGKSELENLTSKKKESLRSLVFSSMLAAVTIARPIAIGATKLATRSAKGLLSLSYKTASSLEKYVRLSKFKMTALKNSPLIKSFNSLYKTKHSKNFSVIASRFKGIKNLQIVKYLQKTGHSLSNIVKKSKAYQALIQDELLLQTLGREIVIELAAIILGEYAIRGDKFWEEFHFVLMNTVLSIGIISLIALKGMKSRQRMWDAWYANDYSTFVKRWAVQAKDLAVPTFAIGLVGNSSIEMMMFFNHIHQDDPEYMSLKDRMIRSVTMATFMAGFIGVASSSRSEIVYQHANKIIDKGIKSGLSKTAIKNGKMNFLAEILKMPISFGNNLMGTLVSTKLARDLGLQVNEEVSATRDMSYIHFEKNTYNHSHLFSLPSN